MPAAWLNEEEEHCSEAVQQVLLKSRKPSIRMAYLEEVFRVVLCQWDPSGGGFHPGHHGVPVTPSGIGPHTQFSETALGSSINVSSSNPLSEPASQRAKGLCTVQHPEKQHLAALTSFPLTLIPEQP